MEQVGLSRSISVASSPSLLTHRSPDSDIIMFASFNSQERDQGDWEELLRVTDPRLKLEEVKRIPNAKLEMIIALWEGGA